MRIKDLFHPVGTFKGYWSTRAEREKLRALRVPGSGSILIFRKKLDAAQSELNSRRDAFFSSNFKSDAEKKAFDRIMDINWPPKVAKTACEICFEQGGNVEVFRELPPKIRQFADSLEQPRRRFFPSKTKVESAFPFLDSWCQSAHKMSLRELMLAKADALEKVMNERPKK